MSRKLLIPGLVIAAIVFALVGLQRMAVDTSLSGWLEGATGFQQAQRLQQSNGKPIAVFFHTDWCASCKKLTANVLGQDPIAAYLTDFIPVKINPERTPADQALADRFSVNAYPSFFILRNQYSAAIRLPVGGNTNQQEFIASCNAAIQS